MSRADPLRVADYLQHILEAISNIQDYTAGMDLDAFMSDRKTRGAVVRNLEVIRGCACWCGPRPCAWFTMVSTLLLPCGLLAGLAFFLFGAGPIPTGHSVRRL